MPLTLKEAPSSMRLSVLIVPRVVIGPLADNVTSPLPAAFTALASIIPSLLILLSNIVFNDLAVSVIVPPSAEMSPLLSMAFLILLPSVPIISFSTALSITTKIVPRSSRGTVVIVIPSPEASTILPSCA